MRRVDSYGTSESERRPWPSNAMKALTSLAWMFGVIGLVASPGRILAQADFVPLPTPKNSEATNQIPLADKVQAKAESAPKSADLSQSPHLSPWLTEVVKLSKAKVDEGVIVAYIDSAGTFNLGAEQIIYLRDQGLANEIIGAILEHDYELLSGQKPIPVSIAPEP